MSDIDSQLWLGVYYYNGDAVPKDLSFVRPIIEININSIY